MLKRSLLALSALLFAHTLTARAAESTDFSAQTRWLLAVDVKAANASPIMKFITDTIDAKKRSQAEAKLAAIEAMFGLNLLEDIDHLVIAGNGGADKGGVAYVYGKFNVQRLTTILAGSKQYESVKHNGVAVQTWLDESDNKKKSIAFPTPNLALISNNPASIEDALDVLAGEKPGLAANAPLGKTLSRTSGNLLSLSAFGLSSIIGAAPNAEALRQAEALSLTIRANGENSLDADLAVTAANDATAQQIHQAFLGIQAISMLRSAEAPESAAVATQAKVACEGRTISVTLSLPKSTIETVIRAREKKGVAATEAN